jgi:hypothetical protein
MAKLYVEIESERTQKHAIGNKFLKIKVFYGSRENSIESLTLLVEATNDLPRVSVSDPEKLLEQNIKSERVEIVSV